MSKIFNVKSHTDQLGQKILAITDANLIGKVFEEGKKVLDLTVEFYKGEEVDKEQLKVLIKDAYILHITGPKSIEFASDMEILGTQGIISIDGVPHAQIVIVRD